MEEGERGRWLEDESEQWSVGSGLDLRRDGLNDIM